LSVSLALTGGGRLSADTALAGRVREA